MHSVIMAKERFRVAFRVAAAFGGPPAPAMKSGVRKKRASRTHLKMNVLLLQKTDFQALRVQNEKGKSNFQKTRWVRRVRGRDS